MSKTIFCENFGGLHGFEELKKYIKQGNEFCKELGGIIQERSDLELNYAKNLQKLSVKLTKCSVNCIGTLASAWSMVATEIESEAELHKSLGNSLHDEVYKSIKTLSETQYKAKKPIEAAVDKAAKYYNEKRNEENKLKKAAHNSAKEREKLIDQMMNTKNGMKGTKEKDVPKLEKAVRKAEDSLRKADQDYHASCTKVENSRLDWEAAVVKGSSQLQDLEEERINLMTDMLNKYNSHLSVLGPKLTAGCDRLGEAVLSVNMPGDLRTVIDQKGTGPQQSEQILPDFYAEDLKNTMDKERRRQALQNYVLYLQQDIEREQKAMEGVQKLVEVYQNRPSFGDADAQEDARLKLKNAKVLLNYYEASYHKISSAIAQLDGRPKSQSRFSDYIKQTKDKQGTTSSVLCLPVSQQNIESDFQRPPVDGGQGAPVHHVDGPPAPPPVPPPTATLTTNVDLQRNNRLSSYDPGDGEFEEFPDQNRRIGRCKVLYDYPAQQYDELSVRQGDIINVYEKQEDGWWQGELRGKVGIFPATYVQEI